MIKINALEALSQGKKNNFSRWGQGDNSAKNRLRSNITIPENKINVKIHLNSKIFTVGSCFARNVEEALVQEGINVLSKDINVPYEVKANRKTGIMNKYNPGSLYHELEWALGRSNFNEEYLIEIDGKYFDLNLKPGELPQDLKVALGFRSEINRYFNQIRDSDIVILTLGMTECWYDSKYDVILNQVPHPKVIREFPDRFKFVVLELNDVVDYLTKSIDLLLSVNVKSVFLTTSPVSLARTFKNEDIITANCSSKSTLRVACDILTTRYEGFVNYFPSYETVIYNNSNISWENDLAHASDYIVTRIVKKFIERHVEGTINNENYQLEEKSKSEVEKLKSQVSHYKNMLIKNGII